jgi:spore coat polysaccharide biosynthesis protein SpsF (cytidylyltransferase family)
MIQARTGSRRFPRKVLSKIENKPMIWHVINRVKQVKGVDQIILVTTKRPQDNVLTRIAKNTGILYFRGYTYDVLSRYYKCALGCVADPIIRITSDCPLIDPTLVEKMLKFYKENNYDYVTNTLRPTFPDGLDVEILSFRTLEKIAHKARLPSDREHVTSYIRNHPNEFRIFNYENKNNLSDLRWTVDEKMDLKLVRAIYAKMRPRLVFPMEDVMRIISKNPEILQINSGINRNEGYLKSLKKDKIK